ncbi:hypothetical protein LTR91_022759 [Friedmanniomyces endolithicus]|uniref:TNFR-Cys domain-containing protein n=2 Tax=Friedmanniomyces endolithicus TaxID=329885 RepID=A0AAN6H524_9PEZI|nr:hypothetical protein LTR59_012133 [Friedmanniomyces endolithicus]KAK0876386.1 hypothetical protein LTR87_009781 [Friedmanniomyces endolithicus]KAK0888229.1 hypothetical protein LTR02_016509 [Friedmanniomyces endolithicus]KAK0955632.1 hypothetical protein LTR91_022759 [Friedmanniomyces endolithicus]
MHRRRLAFLLQSLGLATAHLITSPASLPYVTPIAYPGIGVGQDELFGRLPGRQLFKRASIPCDGNSFWCPTGTCFTATGASYSGLIGCCDVASCAPRTECIPYASGTTSPCDVNTGGCMYCSDSAAPACLTMTNVVDGQWIKYCAACPSTQTISYTPSGSYFVPQSAGVSPTHVVTSSLSQASFSAVPGMQVEPSTIVTTVQSDQSTSGTVTAASSLASAMVPVITNISACVSNECVSTTAPSISSMPNRPSPTTNTNAASAFPTSRPSGTPGGLVAGVVVGIVGACTLLAAGFFAARRHWFTCCGRPHGRERRELQMDKPSTKASTPLSTGKTEDTPELRGVGTFHSPDHIPRPAELNGCTGSVSDPRPVDTVAVHGLGIAGMSPRRYAPTNPDPTSATDEGHRPTGTAPPAGVSEAPGDHPLPVSPAVSSLAPLPDTPSISNTPVGLSAVSPVTPSYRHSSTPYTPSAYQFEPPSSVPRTAAAKPPSLPQDYSSASLGSSANIYRGLSQHGGAPWAYLSPEEAVGGGWRNEEAPDGA